MTAPDTGTPDQRVRVRLDVELWVSGPDVDLLNEPEKADPDRLTDLLNELRERLLEQVPRANEIDWELA